MTPQWKNLHISEPVRWSDNDPLERFTFDALMLNASPVAGDVLNAMNWRQWQFEEINRDQLVNNDALLAELFGLLVLAHYKTSPIDLRHLLDGTNISVYALRVEGHVLATALVAREGNVAAELADGIWLGKRRIRGHLIPQSLSNHLGMRTAISLKGARILRIAVHPEFQRHGLGGEFVRAISDDLCRKGGDYIGSLFGATADLLDFWHSGNLQPVRIGLTREAASGAYSAMVLKPLTAEAKSMFNEGRQRFAEQFICLLSDGLQHLDADIVLQLLKELPGLSHHLNEDDCRDIESFTEGLRLYESCIAPVKKLVWLALSRKQSEISLDTANTSLLVGKVLQNKSWAETVKISGVSGKKQAVSELRKVLGKLRIHCC